LSQLGPTWRVPLRSCASLSHLRHVVTGSITAHFFSMILDEPIHLRPNCGVLSDEIEDIGMWWMWWMCSIYLGKL
jgi:hypothetical protein